MIKSYLNSLEDVDNVGPGYDKVKNTYGEYIKGLKRHVESDILHLFGFINFKRVIVPGSYKTRVRQDLTIAKDELRKNLPVSRFRQFILSPNTLKYITVRGCKLDPPEWMPLLLISLILLVILIMVPYVLCTRKCRKRGSIESPKHLSHVVKEYP